MMEECGLPLGVPILAERPLNAHKGMYGHGLLVGGTSGTAGAVFIAGQSCLRSGAGLVTLAIPESIQGLVSVALPCAMTLGLSEPKDAQKWWSHLQQARYTQSILAIGPGLGRSVDTDELVLRCWESWPNTAIFDADALNAIASSIDRDIGSNVQGAGLARHDAERILTPHPGEWERLTGVGARDRTGQIAKAIQKAMEWNCVIALKGARTLVTDGKNVYENTTGNPSLAVGGSGDCLTGMITAMVCQHLAPFEATVLGVFLHGLAADLGHAALGTPSTLATDIVDYLPAAFRSYRNMQSNDRSASRRLA